MADKTVGDTISRGFAYLLKITGFVNTVTHCPHPFIGREIILGRLWSLISSQFVPAPQQVQWQIWHPGLLPFLANITIAHPLCYCPSQNTTVHLQPSVLFCSSGGVALPMQNYSMSVIQCVVLQFMWCYLSPNNGTTIIQCVVLHFMWCSLSPNKTVHPSFNVLFWGLCNIATPSAIQCVVLLFM